MFVTLEVLNELKLSEERLLKPENIAVILVIFEVLNPVKLILFKLLQPEKIDNMDVTFECFV